MKKAITTIGLFSLMMLLTSFTTTQEITSSTKIDDKVEIFKIENIKLEISGAGGTGGNKKVDDIVRDYLNNIDENIYQLELNEQPETIIDNLLATRFTLTGTANLSHPNGQNMSKNVSIDFYFIEKGKKIYVIRTEIFNNNQNAVKDVEKILQTIKFQ